MDQAENSFSVCFLYWHAMNVCRQDLEGPKSSNNVTIFSHQSCCHLFHSTGEMQFPCFFWGHIQYDSNRPPCLIWFDLHQINSNLIMTVPADKPLCTAHFNWYLPCPLKKSCDLNLSLSTVNRLSPGLVSLSMISEWGTLTRLWTLTKPSMAVGSCRKGVWVNLHYR